LSQLSRHFSIRHNRDQVERSLVIPSLGCRLNVARTAEGGPGQKRSVNKCAKVVRIEMLFAGS
jgi:hypothetical protein